MMQAFQPRNVQVTALDGPVHLIFRDRDKDGLTVAGSTIVLALCQGQTAPLTIKAMQRVEIVPVATHDGLHEVA